MTHWSTIIFDYGGTLADFYQMKEFDEVLRDALWAARSVIVQKVGRVPRDEILWQRAQTENYEDTSDRVRTLEGRLARIFGSGDAIDDAAEAFTISIRSRGALIPGARGVLRDLVQRDYRLGLVSNSPWGCPGDAWLRDLEDRGIADFFDVAISCRDVGFRKPAPQVFHHAFDLLSVPAQQCLFVGDDLRCDVQGSQRVGMSALLFDPHGDSEFCPSVHTLRELVDFVEHHSGRA